MSKVGTSECPDLDQIYRTIGAMSISESLPYIADEDRTASEEIEALPIPILMMMQDWRIIADSKTAVFPSSNLRASLLLREKRII